MNAAIYARYSDDDQRVESIIAQVRACELYAERNGYTVVHVYKDEAISGKGSKTQKRVQYQRMLKDAATRKFDTILIHKYDRVARSVLEHVTLATRLSAENIDLIAVAQDFGASKEAKLMKVLMWAMSEFYIDNLAEEVRKGTRETALQGLFNGGVPPFGYDIADQRYFINQTEAPYVRRMFSACLNRESYNSIISDLAEAGIKGKRGQPIKYSQIYEILRNEKYTGTYLYVVNESINREESRQKKDAIRIDGAIPAIVSREMWETVQKIMEQRKNTGKKAEHLLSGLAVCGECGAPMHCVTMRKNRNGNFYEYKYLVCSGKCGNPCTRTEAAEECVYQTLKNLLNADNREILHTRLQSYIASKRDDIAAEKASIKAAIAARERQIAVLMKNLSSSVLPPSVVESIGQQIQEINTQIDGLRVELNRPFEFSRYEVFRYFDVISALSTKDEILQRNTVRRYVEKVIIKQNAIEVITTFEAFIREIGSGDRI